MSIIFWLLNAMIVALIYNVNPNYLPLWFGAGLLTAAASHLTCNVLVPKLNPLMGNTRSKVSFYVISTLMGGFTPVVMALEFMIKHWPECLVIGGEPEKKGAVKQ